jgi:gamma-glutamyltranspeptidase/glutathione hydrolase
MRMLARLPRFAHAAPVLSIPFLALACATSTPEPRPATPAGAAASRLPGPVADAPTQPVRAAHGMVVSSNTMASEVGMQVLREGGNAIDAAVATGFALAVVHPSAGNIGGGGFMVVRFPDGRTTTFDFREKAPLAASPDMFLDSSGEYSYARHHDSYLSVGVPGTVAGFALAQERYGRLDWARLVRPAAALADTGFALSDALAGSMERVLPRMQRYPASVAKFSRGGTPYRAGERWRQPDLARTLGRILSRGRDGFYAGETAHLIAQEMQRGGGLITEQDLEKYQAKERTPVHGTYRGYDIISMPPPSSGGVALVEMLNILEGYDLAALPHNGPEYIHFVVEAMRRAYRDRARYLADTDFVPVPIDRLLSKPYAAELRAGIEKSEATPSEVSDVHLLHESPLTTHYSVVDADGMAVAVTYTLEQGYGSKIVVPGAGFLLNNEMGDFNAKPGLTDERGLIGTDGNLARPQQRMLSSMTPSILAKDGKLVAVIGSPGGRTIINTVLQVVLNVIDGHMNIQQAVDAGRLHHQWLPDRIRIEDGTVSDATLQALRHMGYTVRVGGRQGSSNDIMIDPRTGERLGAPDPRDVDAGAAGY